MSQVLHLHFRLDQSQAELNYIYFQPNIQPNDAYLIFKHLNFKFLSDCIVVIYGKGLNCCFSKQQIVGEESGYWIDVPKKYVVYAKFHQNKQMDRESDQDENYAIIILNELRSSKFVFKEEQVKGGCKYTFVVPNNEENAAKEVEAPSNGTLQSESSEPVEASEERPDPDSREPVPKNLIKNFVCAFTNFLNEAKEESTFLQLLRLNKEGVVVLHRLRHQLASLQKSKRYNTEMLETILSAGEYRALFQLFLRQKAGEWVTCGRMRNKEAHSSAIVYLQEYLDYSGHPPDKHLKFSSRRPH